MKKILLVILVICGFLVCGCGNTENEKESLKLDLKKVGEKLATLSVDGTKVFADKDNLNDLDLIKGYGINVDLLNDYVIYLSSSVEDPSMYMVLQPKSDNVSVVKYQVNDMFKEYLAAYQGYYPEAVPTINNRMKKEEGEYLIYIVSKDNNNVYSKIMECKD